MKAEKEQDYREDTGLTKMAAVDWFIIKKVKEYEKTKDRDDI